MVTIKLSSYPEKWYCSYQKCVSCGTEFMCSKANYCPGCGERIGKIFLTDEMEDKKK